MVPAALQALLERRDELVSFARRRAPSGVDPEELVQQALLVATKKIDQLREPDLVVAWFYRILRRTVADERARSAVRQAKLPLLEAEAREEASGGEAELCGCSVGLVDTLSPAYAEVLRRVDIGGEDIAEVASTLGTTPNNVTVRLHRARKTLRERLAATCGTTSLASCLDCDCV